jgi:cob(I)alamin adenosyltransferase
MRNRGLVQIYTGDGKGKTTAALGLALRATGAGKKVYIGQFLKGKTCSEHRVLKKFKTIKVEQYGRSGFIKRTPQKKDIKLAKAGLNKIKKIFKAKTYDLVILDEINLALHFNLLDLGEVVQLIKTKPKTVELVLTGRYVHPRLIELADLVTVMKEVKHYFKKGVKARLGIED